MLIINGENDILVPQGDTCVFEGRARTEVHMLPDTGHCAVSKLTEVLDIIANDFRRTLVRISG
jgi:esterase FrsA